MAAFAYLVIFQAQTSLAQINDNPLPEVPLGEISINLRSFATGLPVQREFITPVFTQRVGPTDLAELPNGNGQLVVTTYGGVAFLLDRNGSVNDTPFLDLFHDTSPT